MNQNKLSNFKWNPEEILYKESVDRQIQKSVESHVLHQLDLSIVGTSRKEMPILFSDTERNKSRLSVNLPGHKECFGALLQSFDYSELETKVEAMLQGAYLEAY